MGGGHLDGLPVGTEFRFETGKNRCGAAGIYGRATGSRHRVSLREDLGRDPVALRPGTAAPATT